MAWVSFGASLILSLPLIWAVREISIRAGKIARPRPDRWHARPTAMMGGIGIFAAFSLAILAAIPAGLPFDELPWGILLGSAIVFGLGLYDDLHPISPPAKLVGQILAAAVVIASGYTTAFFTPRIADSLAAQLPNILLTFFWLVGITNAINLLDNMDGLAGGISLITAVFLSLFFWQARDYGMLVVSLSLVGGLLGFLVFNFPPASIFMGDSGSLFLGFTLASLAIARLPQASNVFAVMGAPTLLFLLPILDTTLVTFTRVLRGQSPAQGGRDHTSHRLIAFGLSERQAVLALYSIALLSGIAAIALEALSYWLSLLLVPTLVIALALLTAYLGGLKVVVSPTVPLHERRGITRIMLELTFKRRLLEVILDFFLIGIAYYLAFLVRFSLVITPQVLEAYLQSLPLALAATYLSFFIFGVYRGVWRYVGMEDLLRFGKSAIGSMLFAGLGWWFFYDADLFSPILLLLFGVFLFLGLFGSRSSFRLLDRFSQRQARTLEQRVIICGADDAGELALRWISMNPDLGYRPVGIVDTNPLLAGRRIHDVAVLGGPEQLEGLLKDFHVDGIIITPRGQKIQDLVMSVCEDNGVWVRSMRLEFELLD